VKRAIGTTGPWHDIGHLVCFAITGWLFLGRSADLPSWQVWPAAALAFGLEGMEAALYGNRFEWGDIAVDLLGVLLGLALYRVRESRLRVALR
jgi:hypothetical protein